MLSLDLKSPVLFRQAKHSSSVSAHQSARLCDDLVQDLVERTIGVEDGHDVANALAPLCIADVLPRLWDARSAARHKGSAGRPRE
jgi:hypothetical protein